MASRLANLASQHAQRLAAEGDLEGAYGVLANIRAAQGSDPTVVVQARGEIESRLLGELRRRFSDLDAVPTQAVSSARLREYKLRSFEAYLWSLFDGVTSLQDAIDVSNAPELDALRAIAKLADQRLITIPGVAALRAA